jgi:hypothetical protein
MENKDKKNYQGVFNPAKKQMEFPQLGETQDL